MKKLLTLFLSLILVFSAVGCNQPTPTPGGNGGGTGSDITLSANTLSLPINAEQTIFATVKGEETVTWSSSDKSIVSVTADGNSAKILALSAGEAEVTAELGSSKATCYVTVINQKLELALELGVEAVEIRNGGSLYVPATVSLGNEVLEGATFDYAIADTSIATVANGEVTGVKEGETSLSVVADYQGRKSNVVTVPVTVKSGSVLIVSNSSVTLYALATGSEAYPVEQSIEVKLYNGSSESAVTYTATSSNEDVATITSGVIKAKSVGEAIIEIACEQGGVSYTAKVYVTVKSAPMVVFKFPESEVDIYTLEAGKPASTYQLQPKIYVNGLEVDASSATYELVSGNVVSASASGLLTATSAQEGSAVVKVKFVFQGKEYTDTINVNAVMDTTLYFGNHIETGYAVEGMVVRMTEGDTVMYNNVNFTNNKDDSLVRFQIIQDGAPVSDGYTAPIGAENFFITLQDAAKPSNYLTVFLTTLKIADPYYAYGAAIGARVSSWVSYEVGSKDAVFHALKSGAKPIGIATQDWAGYNYGVNGYSLYNYWLDKYNAGGHHSSTCLEHQMISIGVQGKSVYFHINGTTIELLNMTDKVSGQAPWEGFTGDKLNVFVTTTGYNGSDQTHLVFDTLGAAEVTAEMKLGFKVEKLGTSLVPN